jgi:hypothetical protein
MQQGPLLRTVTDRPAHGGCAAVQQEEAAEWETWGSRGWVACPVV